MFYCEISAYIAFYHPYRLLFLQKEIQVGFELAKKNIGENMETNKIYFQCKMWYISIGKKGFQCISCLWSLVG